MSLSAKCYGIIPARYESTRFRGKPLVDILGKPMFWHVWSQAMKCPVLQSVTLATDSAQIAQKAEELSVPYVLTSSKHPSGTDRVNEAAKLLKLPKDSVIINIQGDEPALDPAMLTELVEPFKNAQTQVSTLAYTASFAEANSANRVKVVLSDTGRALYFSRHLLPFNRNQQNLTPTEIEQQKFLLHIGLYAFKFEVLEKFTKLPQSYLEKKEQLEQLRLLENNIDIQVVKTNRLSYGVDVPEDLEKVLALVKLNLQD